MMVLIILFRLFQIMSAYLFAIRMFGQLYQQHLINKKLLTKIGTLLFFLIFFIHALPLPSELWRWLLLLTGLCLLYGSIHLLIFQREKSFQRKFIFFLDRLLILLRTGWGFRSAFDRIVEEECGFEKAKLMQFRSAVVFSQHKNELAMNHSLGESIREMRRAHSYPHESVRRIENLRRKLKMEHDFRHKSGQILFQIRIQSWILLGLYIALLLIVLIRQGFKLHVSWLLLSLLLFTIGIAWTFSIGRRIKWKI